MRFPTNGKNLRYPAGNVIQGWGENVALYKQSSNGTIFAGHPGIDIVPEVGYGEPLYAIADGVVVATLFQNTGYGHEVAVLSDYYRDGWQMQYLYGHMIDQQVVKVGDRVKEGDIIGYMGNSGFVVSGGVAFWGESNPDHKGTHVHLRTWWVKEVAAGQPSNTSFLGKNYLIRDYGNGCNDSFDPETLYGESMTNSLIVKNGAEWGIYDPATSEDGLVTLMRNRGMDVPLTPDGKLDWTKVVAAKQLN